MLLERVYKLFKSLYMSVICWFVVSCPQICYYLCKRNLCGMDKQTFLSELAKYARLFHSHSKGFGARELQSQVYAFTFHSISVISDTLRLADDPCDPIVITVVRDDLERMKLFCQHYRNLGVKQFVVIDNGSTDGTLEWVSQQQGTRCYRVSAKFQTESKVAWLEKALALTCYNHWYVVVDSDELLDFVGSEQHDLKDLILYAEDKGYKHLNGYMLDMYSDQPLFSEDCGCNEIVSRFRYFDVSGYFLKNHGSWVLDREVCSLKGGSRARLFSDEEISLNKQSVFYYEPDTLYCHPHYFWPYSRWDEKPCSFVLRHYKFLKRDLQEFEKRAVEKTFWNGSQEYKNYLKSYLENPAIGMKNEESEEFRCSLSLSALPFLESPFMNDKKKEHE